MAQIIISNMCFILFCMAGIAKVVFFGIYAFDNPDSEAWYGTDLTTGEPKLFESENGASQDSELIDVHERFVIWFFWGFTMFVAPFFAGILILVASLIAPLFGQFCGMLAFCSFGASYLAWYVTGIVWRFRKDGAFSCGDALTEAELED